MSSAVLPAFKSLAATFSDCSIFWPNDPFTPPTDPIDPTVLLPFVIVEKTSLGSDLLGSGSKNLGRQHGFYRFHVMVLTRTGIELAESIAGNLAACFRAANPIPGLQIGIPTDPEDGAASDDGNYYGISFSVPWSYLATA